MKYGKVSTVVFFFFFFPTIYFSAFAGQPSPKAFVPESLFESPTVLEGEKVVHDYVIQNKGDAELVITDVKTG